MGHAASLSPKQQSSIAPELASQVTGAGEYEEYNVLVRMSDGEMTPSRVSSLAASAQGIQERYQTIGGALRSAAASAVPSVQGESAVVRRFWIANVVEMRVDRVAMLALAEQRDVVMIAPNVSIELLDPVSIVDAVAASAGAGSNLQAIGARALWSRGLTGKGRLVASIDTGVEGVHPALSGNWRGKHGDTSASWFDPLNGAVPTDNSGHGTHVMGIMVGRDGADTIGLAPDAEWIAAAVVDRGRSLSATFADILAALQWVVDPDGNPLTMDDVPDVVCNSWGVSQQIISPCDQLFFEAIDNVESMGVVCVFAAGNEGPNTMSIRNPADRATSPTASFSVGAVDASVTGFPVPSFSSRGPSACDGLAKKPEIAAPGVAIRSAYKGQTYRLINGTSMAAPHVAAAVALLRQYNPELTPEQIKSVLLSTAQDIGTPGEDNLSGRGLIDLEAAIASVVPANFPLVSTGSITLNAGADGVPALGEVVELSIPISGDVVDANNITLILESMSADASVQSGSAYIGTVPAGGTVTNAGSPFVIQVSGDATAGDTAWFEVRMSGDPLLTWWRDTIGVMIGLPHGAHLETASDGAAALTHSNFGQFGLADGSVLNAGGNGWKTSFMSANILHEGALIVSSANGGWADASHQDEGGQRFDFSPMLAAGAGAMCFDDAGAQSPVGVTIDQVVMPILRTATYEITIVRWNVRNTRGGSIDDLQLGWLLDIDLPVVETVAEEFSIDPSTGGFYHSASYGGFVAGMASLSGSFSAINVFENFAAKAPLSTSAKQSAMSGFGSIPEGTGDFVSVSASNPVDLDAGESVVIAVAFIAANDPGSFSAASIDARNRWLSISDVNDDQGGVRPPSDYRLEQNYPNPFNAGTTIPIQVAGDGSRNVRLEVFDVLGRSVRTLMNEPAAYGQHALFWDGRDDNGSVVASGVYFARLRVDGQAQEVRSMVLLK
jgi:subtilisin family serine protease